MFTAFSFMGTVRTLPRDISTPSTATRAIRRQAFRMLSVPLQRAHEWREVSYRLMDSRDWPAAEQAIFEAVCGDRPLPGDESDHYSSSSHVPVVQDDVPRENQFVRGSRIRHTWALTIAYSGKEFSGYAWQPDAPKPTVAGCIQSALRSLVGNEPKILGAIACAGRTDAGVSALGQRISFWCWPELEEAAIVAAVAAAAPIPGSLRVVSAKHTLDKTYHATFGTAWRRYAFLLPPAAGATRADVEKEAAEMDAMLRALAHEPRDYSALARGMPKGKDTTMTLYHASARVVPLGLGSSKGSSYPSTTNNNSLFATRVDLVGDRFLRRQVRTLVATAAATTSAALKLQREMSGRLSARAPTAAASLVDVSQGDGDAAHLPGCAATQPPSAPQLAADHIAGADALADAVADVPNSAGLAQALLHAVTSGRQELTAHAAPAEGLIFAAAGGEGEDWRWRRHD